MHQLGLSHQGLLEEARQALFNQELNLKLPVDSRMEVREVQVVYLERQVLRAEQAVLQVDLDL